MNPLIPRMTPDQLERLKGGELVVRYLECVRRYERMPQAGWLRQRLDETGMEITRRQSIGTLSEALCGLLAHVHDGARTIAQCSCSTE